MRRSRSTGTPARRVAASSVLAGLLAALSLLLGAAPAQAAGAVTPLADCYVQNSNGTYTAVLGYSNTTGRSVTIPVGTSNTLSPTTYNGRQPTTFKSGTYHGVFNVTFTQADAAYANWTLNGTSLSATTAVATCPPGTTLPGTGNGTGAAFALLAAGLVGAVLVRRARRRAGVVAQPAG